MYVLPAVPTTYMYLHIIIRKEIFTAEYLGYYQWLKILYVRLGISWGGGCNSLVFMRN